MSKSEKINAIIETAAAELTDLGCTHFLAVLNHGENNAHVIGELSGPDISTVLKLMIKNPDDLVRVGREIGNILLERKNLKNGK